MVRGDLGGGLTQPLGLARQRMAVELGSRDGQIAEVGTRVRVAFVVIIKGSLHDDRFQRRSQCRGRQGSRGRRYAEFPDRERGGVPQGSRDPHRGVRRLKLAVVEQLADPLDRRPQFHTGKVPHACGTD